MIDEYYFKKLEVILAQQDIAYKEIGNNINSIIAEEAAENNIKALAALVDFSIAIKYNNKIKVIG